jgi:hypothetical protein
MVKSLSSFAILTVLAASVVALPIFASKAQPAEPAAFAKADRLKLKAPASECSAEVWPKIATSCLHGAGPTAKIVEARLVTARR